MDDGKPPNPALAIAQAAVALAILIALPMFLSPDSAMDIAIAGVAALVLLGFLFEGVARFARSRQPRQFLDSVMPDQHVNPEETITPVKRKDS